MSEQGPMIAQVLVLDCESHLFQARWSNGDPGVSLVASWTPGFLGVYAAPATNSAEENGRPPPSPGLRAARSSCPRSSNAAMHMRAH